MSLGTAIDEILQAPVDALPDEDALIRAAILWHFSPETGAPFWLRRAESLGFDPRDQVHTRTDLLRFPDVSSEWRTAPIEDLVPRGIAESGSAIPYVYDSGGTTGAPKRIAEFEYWRRTAAWTSDRLDAIGMPRGGNWLYLGPTGPHVAGALFIDMARRRGGACFTVDFDPRWVRRCAQEGRTDDVDRYIRHILDQARWVLETQSVQILWATPPLLTAMADTRLGNLVRSKVGGILWSGTSTDQETLRLLDDEVFPDLPLAGIYGNTLMGVAPQRPPLPDDEYRCVFQPFHPHVLLDVIDPDTGNQVDHGRRGQVRLHHLSREMFLPAVLERDLATRLAPAPGSAGDCVADIRPAPTTNRPIVEGVY
ncbi:hypothetical protein [Nocardia sp. BMG51109]|uniref:hypothetical protein n=1 Tax=Nocardia sp. BMG51109 TaxID=1056816 RepID=UPI0004669F95|nr:hypothetical protein [Nocardia sp. BMG51109]